MNFCGFICPLYVNAIKVNKKINLTTYCTTSVGKMNSPNLLIVDKYVDIIICIIIKKQIVNNFLANVGILICPNKTCITTRNPTKECKYAKGISKPNKLMDGNIIDTKIINRYKSFFL